MRVLVCGSRSWTDGDAIRRELSLLNVGDVVIHGGARGADRCADVAARALGLDVEMYLPDWGTFGRSAGMIRNEKMLDANPDKVLAFWDGRSTGTAHTIESARRRGIPVKVFVVRS